MRLLDSHHICGVELRFLASQIVLVHVALHFHDRRRHHALDVGQVLVEDALVDLLHSFGDELVLVHVR